MADLIHPAFKELGTPVPMKNPKTKFPPETGYTGYDPAFVMSWSDAEKRMARGENIGLRPHGDIVIIDVDAYKSALPQDAADFLDTYGITPDVMRVSARFHNDDISGHYYFRLPPEHNAASTLLRELPVGEVIDYRYYVMLPPSVHPEAGTYEVRNPGAVRTLDREFYRFLQQPVAAWHVSDADARVFDLLAHHPVTEEHARITENQILKFRNATEGNRDDRHHVACRSIGTLWRMSGDSKQKDKQVARMLRYGKKNGADAATMKKTRKHVQRGYDQPSTVAGLDFGELDFWFSRPAYEEIYWTAYETRHSPWAILAMYLTFLSAGTDHRVRVSFNDAFQPTPAAIWTILVGRSGAGKSSTVRAGKQWLDSLDLQLPLPPKPIPLKPLPIGVDNLRHSDHSKHEARKGCPKNLCKTPTTSNGVGAMFETRVKGTQTRKFGQKEKKVPAEVMAFGAYRRIAWYDEPDVLTGAAARKYNLVSQLQSSYYSDGFDHSVGRAEDRYYVEDRSYVLSLILNVPNERVSKFLDHDSYGFLQRAISVNTESVIRSMQLSPVRPADAVILDWEEVIQDWDPVINSDGEMEAIVTFDDAAKDMLARVHAWITGHHYLLSETEVESMREYIVGRVAGHSDTH